MRSVNMTWQTKKLENCLDKVVYTNKVQRKDFLKTGSFPIISQEYEFINGYWNNKKDLFRSKTPIIVFGDHTQVLKYVDFDFVLGADGVKILKPSNYLDPRFLYYFLHSIDLKSLGYARHFRLLKEVEVPFPPITEQKRIVKKLDEVFEQIAKAKENTEKNLKNAKELFESYLQDVFTNLGKGWEKKRIGEVCVLKSGTTIHKSLERSFGDTLYVKVGDMNFTGNEIFIYSSSRFVNSDDINKKQIIPEGSVIFPKRGGAIFTNKRRKIIKPTIVDLNTMALVPSKLLNPDYLYYWFLGIDLTDLNSGSSIPQINNYSFDNIYIAYPKLLAEQESIVKKLDTLSAETKKLEAIYKQKLADLEELKKSVLKKAFVGEL